MQQFPTSSKNIPTINKWIPRNIQSFFHIRKKKNQSLQQIRSTAFILANFSQPSSTNKLVCRMTEVEEAHNPTNLQIPFNGRKSPTLQFRPVPSCVLSLLAIDCVVTAWQTKPALSSKASSRRALQVKRDR